jgi:hypothetical protein
MTDVPVKRPKRPRDPAQLAKVQVAEAKPAKHGPYKKRVVTARV